MHYLTGYRFTRDKRGRRRPTGYAHAWNPEEKQAACRAPGVEAEGNEPRTWPPYGGIYRPCPRCRELTGRP